MAPSRDVGSPSARVGRCGPGCPARGARARCAERRARASARARRAARQVHTRSRVRRQRAAATPSSQRSAPHRRPSARPPRVHRARRRASARSPRLIALLVRDRVLRVRRDRRLACVDSRRSRPEQYARLGLDQRVRTVQLAAERGSVFDRNGHDLARLGAAADGLGRSRGSSKDPAAYAAQLAPIVGVDEATLRERLSQRDKGIRVRRPQGRRADDAAR